MAISITTKIDGSNIMQNNITHHPPTKKIPRNQLTLLFDGDGVE